MSLSGNDGCGLIVPHTLVKVEGHRAFTWVINVEPHDIKLNNGRPLSNEIIEEEGIFSVEPQSAQGDSPILNNLSLEYLSNEE